MSTNYVADTDQGNGGTNNVDNSTAQTGPRIFTGSHLHEFLIRRKAQQYGVDPNLALSVAQTESAGDPNAFNKKSQARGLFQIIPSTAKDLGVDSSDVSQNIDGGVRYLKQLGDQYGGDVDKTLAAYNWGPGKLQKYGMARAPLETRNYIKNINARLASVGGSNQSVITQDNVAPQPTPGSNLEKFLNLNNSASTQQQDATQTNYQYPVTQVAEPDDQPEQRMTALPASQPNRPSISAQTPTQPGMQSQQIDNNFSFSYPAGSNPFRDLRAGEDPTTPTNTPAPMPNASQAAQPAQPAQPAEEELQPTPGSHLEAFLNKRRAELAQQQPVQPQENTDVKIDFGEPTALPYVNQGDQPTNRDLFRGYESTPVYQTVTDDNGNEKRVPAKATNQVNNVRWFSFAPGTPINAASYQEAARNVLRSEFGPELDQYQALYGKDPIAQINSPYTPGKPISDEDVRRMYDEYGGRDLPFAISPEAEQGIRQFVESRKVPTQQLPDQLASTRQLPESTAKPLSYIFNAVNQIPGVKTGEREAGAIMDALGIPYAGLVRGGGVDASDVQGFDQMTPQQRAELAERLNAHGQGFGEVGKNLIYGATGQFAPVVGGILDAYKAWEDGASIPEALKAGAKTSATFALMPAVGKLLSKAGMPALEAITNQYGINAGRFAEFLGGMVKGGTEMAATNTAVGQAFGDPLPSGEDLGRQFLEGAAFHLGGRLLPAGEGYRRGGLGEAARSFISDQPTPLHVIFENNVDPNSPIKNPRAVGIYTGEDGKPVAVPLDNTRAQQYIRAGVNATALSPEEYSRQIGTDNGTDRTITSRTVKPGPDVPMTKPTAPTQSTEPTAPPVPTQPVKQQVEPWQQTLNEYNNSLADKTKSQSANLGGVSYINPAEQHAQAVAEAIKQGTLEQAIINGTMTKERAKEILASVPDAYTNIVAQAITERQNALKQPAKPTPQPPTTNVQPVVGGNRVKRTTITQPPIDSNLTTDRPLAEQDNKQTNYQQTAQQLGLSPEQTEAMRPRTVQGLATGQNPADDITPTLDRTIQHVQQTGEPAFYISGETRNVASLNKKFGASATNNVLEANARILQAELGKLQQQGATVHVFENGTGLGAIVMGADENAVNAAKQAAQDEADKLAAKHGLDTLQHARGEADKAGGGLQIVSSPITGQESSADLRARLGKELEASYQGRAATLDQSRLALNGKGATVPASQLPPESRPILRNSEKWEFEDAPTYEENEWHDRARAAGLSDQQIQALKDSGYGPQIRQDAKTGLLKPDDYKFTVKRALEHLRQHNQPGMDNVSNEPGTLISYDIGNVGSSNTHFGKEHTDQVINDIVHIAENQLQNEVAGASISHVRVGGDEGAFVVVGAPADLAQRAMENAKAEVLRYTQQGEYNGKRYADLPHSKGPHLKGFSLYYGIQDLNPYLPGGNNLTADEAISSAEKKVEDAKKAEQEKAKEAYENGSGKTLPPGSSGNDGGGTAPGSPGAISPGRNEGQGPPGGNLKNRSNLPGPQGPWGRGSTPANSGGEGEAGTAASRARVSLTGGQPPILQPRTTAAELRQRINSAATNSQEVTQPVRPTPGSNLERFLIQRGALPPNEISPPVETKPVTPAATTQPTTATTAPWQMTAAEYQKSQVPANKVAEQEQLKAEEQLRITEKYGTPEQIKAAREAYYTARSRAALDNNARRHGNAVADAISNGSYDQAIANGEMTPEQVQKIIDSAKHTPQVQRALANKQSAPTETTPTTQTNGVSDQVAALRSERDQRIANVKNNSNLSPTDKAAATKAISMQYAAKERQLTGNLTAKEQAAQTQRQASNYQGKAVSVDLDGQTISGNIVGHTFGKVKVQLEDGRTVNVEPEKVSARQQNASTSTTTPTQPTPVTTVENTATKPVSDMTRDELLAEKQRLEAQQNADYWKFTRQANAKPLASNSMDRLNEVRVALGEKIYPWQRTQQEMAGAAGGNMSAKTHQQLVEKALKDGKPVPPEVLKDYPDLAAKYGIAQQPTEDATENETPTHPVLDKLLAKTKDGKATMVLPKGEQSALGNWLREQSEAGNAERIPGAAGPGGSPSYIIDTPQGKATISARGVETSLSIEPTQSATVPPATTRVPTGADIDLNIIDQLHNALTGQQGSKIIATGKPSVVTTPRGTEANTHFAIVEADDLQTSHDTNFQPNPNYDQRLQGRDRSKAAYQQQVREITSQLKPSLLADSPEAGQGAPIVGNDLQVESGNGRSIALKTAYESNPSAAGTYRKYLMDHAAEFGLDPEDIAKANNPVLVRVREDNGIDRYKFSDEANMPSQNAPARMSPAEQASADAKLIDSDLLSTFEPSDDGQILTPANRKSFIPAFLDRLSPSERGSLIGADKDLNAEGVRRIKNAILQKAFGGTPEGDAVLQRIIEDPSNNFGNIANAMLKHAGKFASMRDDIANGNRFDLDITPDITAAVKKLSDLRDQGTTVSDYLNQGALFGDDLTPLQREILKALDANKRSTKKIADIFDNYLQLADSTGDPKQESMFGEDNPPSREDIFDSAVQQATNRGQQDLYLHGGFPLFSQEAIEKFFERDIKGSTQRGVQFVKDAFNFLRNTFAPDTKDAASKYAAGSIREAAARREIQMARMERANHVLMTNFDKLPDKDVAEFNRRFAANQVQQTPVLQQYANSIKNVDTMMQNKLATLGNNAAQRYNQHLSPQLPLDNNPVRQMLTRAAGVEHFIAGQNIFNELNQMGLVQSLPRGSQLPPGYVRVEDPVKRLFGQGGDLMVHESAANVLHNYTSKGFGDIAPAQAWRAIGNLTNMLRVSYSGFHALTVGTEGMINHVMTAATYARNGKWADAIKSIASAPLAPILDYQTGAAIKKAALADPSTLSPQMLSTLDQLYASGARIGRSGEYKTGFVNSMMRELYQGNTPGALLLRSPLAITELLARPIMEKLVPNMKLGMWSNMMDAALSGQDPAKMSRSKLRDMGGQIWDEIENRVGEVTSENDFSNKFAKDSIRALFSYPGWNMGTIKQLGGVVPEMYNLAKSIKTGQPVMSNKVLYWASAGLTMTVLGGLINGISTGKLPQSWKDVVYPRNGQKNDDGTDQRLTMPTIVKDVPSLLNSPIKTIGGKVRGEFSTLWNLYHNEDATGRQIYSDDDNVIGQKGADMAAYLFSEMFAPISLRNSYKAIQKGDWAGVASSVIGANPAPAAISRTPAQQMMRDLAKAKMSAGAMSKDAAQAMDERGQLRRDLAQGNTTSTSQALNDNTISPKQAEKLYNNRNLTPDQATMKNLSLDDALKVYASANADERKAMAPQIQDKVKSLDNLTPAERVKQLEKMRALGLTPTTDEPRYNHNLSVDKEHVSAQMRMEKLDEFNELSPAQKDRARKALARYFGGLKVKEAKPNEDPADHQDRLDSAKEKLDDYRDSVDEKGISDAIYDAIDRSYNKDDE